MTIMKIIEIIGTNTTENITISEGSRVCEPPPCPPSHSSRGDSAEKILSRPEYRKRDAHYDCDNDVSFSHRADKLRTTLHFSLTVREYFSEFGLEIT